jgi:hypothetical protein
VHDALPEEEIPGEDSIKDMARAAASAPGRPSPQFLTFLAIVCVVIFFVAVGIIIGLVV